MADIVKTTCVPADDFEGFLAVVSSPAKFPSVVEKVGKIPKPFCFFFSSSFPCTLFPSPSILSSGFLFSVIPFSMFPSFIFSFSCSFFLMFLLSVPFLLFPSSVFPSFYFLCQCNLLFILFLIVTYLSEI